MDWDKEFQNVAFAVPWEQSIPFNVGVSVTEEFESNSNVTPSITIVFPSVAPAALTPPASPTNDVKEAPVADIVTLFVAPPVDAVIENVAVPFPLSTTAIVPISVFALIEADKEFQK